MAALMNELKAEEEEQNATEHLKHVVLDCQCIIEALLPALSDGVLQCTDVEQVIREVRAASGQFSFCP